MKGERRMMITFSKIHNHHDNTIFNDLDLKGNSTIPVIVTGQALTRKWYPVKRQSSNSSRTKDDKVLIIGDSHTRLCAINVKSEIKDSHDVQGLVKPGAGSETLVNSATTDTANLTRNDVVIFCGGANDVKKQLENGPEAYQKLYKFKQPYQYYLNKCST